MLMFLPPELLTLAVLGTAVAAFPQASVPVADSIAINATATSSFDSGRVITSETPETPEIPEVPEDEANPCRDPGKCPHREIPELPTATGFDEDEFNRPTSAPTSQADTVVTSNIQTIIGVETNTAARVGVPAASPVVDIPVASLGGNGNDAERNMGQPNTALQKDITISTGSPKQPVASPVGMVPSTVVLPNPQQTSQSNLLLDVISRLGQASSPAQPTSPSSGTTETSGEDSPVNSVVNSHNDGITPGPSPAPGMPTATSPPPIPAGNSITLGSAVLTLTPGVSTTIGPSSDQTFIAITTNVAGSTLVTISSSGTVVTATVSSTPTLVTLSKTEFDASTTSGAHPERSTGKLSTTSTSKGLAVENRKSEIGWWTSAILGFLPFVYGL